MDRDAVNDDGIRANTNRASALADMLDSYSGSLNDSSFDFTGSAFKDLADYKSKLKAAADYLRDGNYDNNDAAALDAIGFGRTLRDQLLGNGQEEVVDDDPNSYNNLLKAKKRELDADLKAGIITREEYNEELRRFSEEYKDQKYGDAIYDRNYQNWANDHWNWTGDTYEGIQQMGTKGWDDAKHIQWAGAPGTSEADKVAGWIEDPDNQNYAAGLMN